MKKFNKALLIVVFIAVCITTVGLRIQNNKLTKHRDYLELVSEAKDKQIASFVENRMKAVYQYNFYKLPVTDSVYSFDKQKKIAIGSLTEQGPVLILRLLETDCPPCVDSTLYCLDEQCKLLGKSQVAILTDKSVPRDIIVFARSHKISFSIYKVDKGGVSIPLEEYTPYFFMLEKSSVMYDVFLVKKDYMNLTNSYLKMMTEKLL